MFSTTARSSSERPVESDTRLLDEVVDPPEMGLDLDGVLDTFRERRDLRAHGRAGAGHHVGTTAGHSFDDDVDAVRRLGHLTDDGHRTDAPEIVGHRIVVVALLQRHEQHAIAAERAIHRLDGDGPVDRQRLEGERKRHRAPQREDGKLGWKCGRRRFGHAGGLGSARSQSISGTRRLVGVLDLQYFGCEGTR